MSTAAEELLGEELANGWVVIQKLPPAPKGSVGYFSLGYIVEQETSKRRGFLKALDYARILTGEDPAAVMLEQTRAFTFERDILRICRARRLDRVIEVIDEGSVIPKGRGPTEVVQYLIFELADGDARRQSNATNRYDAAWALRALHHVATGLSQLHRQRIAHQDMKPSNVLTFGPGLSKVGDLGRAASQGNMAPHDDFLVAGDAAYAPPESLYGAPPTDWNARRFGCDQYLLGSLISSFFLGAAITPLVQERLDPAHRRRAWRGDYGEVLPYLRRATDEVVAMLKSELVGGLPEHLRERLVSALRELCEPDYRRRGHPRDFGASENQFSLVRYVALFNLLANEARAIKKFAA
jgi:serine/threonine protein kinase